jgi:chromosome segregation ATPase
MTKFKKLIASAELNEAHERITELEAENAGLNGEVKMYGAANGELKDLLAEATEQMQSWHRIAEENEAAHIDCAESGEAQRQRAEQAEAALADMKARRCDCCAHGRFDGIGTECPTHEWCARTQRWEANAFSCADWAARAEQGSRND